MFIFFNNNLYFKMIFTNETLKGSVKEWLKDEISCERKYGHLAIGMFQKLLI